MSCLAHSLGHLLLRLNLHVHITRTCLDRPDKLALGDLHSPDLSALLRQILQRLSSISHLGNTARCHQRNIGREQFINLLLSDIASVKTDLRHLAILQSLIDLLQIPILYSSTNHNLTSKVQQPHPQ